MIKKFKKERKMYFLNLFKKIFSKEPEPDKSRPDPQHGFP